jgi:L-histidine N-alpha-methyltransferase
MEPAMTRQALSLDVVRIHGSLRASHQRVLRRAALESGVLDPSFHYQSVRQSELWMEVHRRHAPAAVDPSFMRIFQQVAESLSVAVAGRAVHVLGLGAGGGEKESLILQILRESGCTVRYTPIDVSVELALASAEVALPFVEGPIVPVAADLRSLAQTDANLLFETSAEVRLVTAFGLLPNFVPSEIFRLLSNLLRPGDLLAVSANLAPAGNLADASAAVDFKQCYEKACQRIVPQYDNAETRRWLRQVLVDWGLDSLLGETCFGLEWLEDVLGICARCDWKTKSPLRWEGTLVEFDAAQMLRLFFSLRYTPEILTQKMRMHGFCIRQGFCTPCGEEGVWAAVRLDRE